MMKLSFLILFCFTALCISCNDDDNTISKEDADVVVKEVKQTLTKYFSDIRNTGLLAEFDYVDTASGFFWVPPGYNSALTLDSVSTILTANARLEQKIDNRWIELQVYPLTKEYANYTGTIASKITDSSGTVTNEYRLIETGLMIKRYGGWKLLSGQTALLPMNQK